MSSSLATPIPMLLVCPSCGRRHVDRGEFATSKVHHTHACQYCGMVWRPAVVPTVGVQFLPGFKDAGPPIGDDDTIKARCVEALREHGGIVKAVEIARVLSDVDADVVRTTLSKLALANEIERHGRGHYRAAPSSPSNCITERE